ncbi:lachrymatory-factor synthase-like [Impatiens glandulifera]|uniref:lachrymatory-factor synthase-like n=1 Tax=Impatiens glandulifera TaxID=253017 RepID=UPI001FB0FE77|nr:lachrymatory-factor synthase-like [Impatiens glandulifera]
MASIEVEEQKRWEGTTKSKINGVSKDRVWPFLADFFNWQTIFLAIESSVGVEGISGEIGCVRKVVLKPEASLGWEAKYSRWGFEKLVEIDHARKWMRYEVLDNTFGWNNYEATITLLPLQGNSEGSELVWSFSLDPVEDGRSLDTMIAAYKANLESVSARVEQLFGISK